MSPDAPGYAAGFADGRAQRQSEDSLKSPLALKIHITRYVHPEWLVSNHARPGFTSEWDAYKAGYIAGYRE